MKPLESAGLLKNWLVKKKNHMKKNVSNSTASPLLLYNCGVDVAVLLELGLLFKLYVYSYCP